MKAALAAAPRGAVPLADRLTPYSTHQLAVLTRLRDQSMTTRAIRRPTSIVLAKQALIMRLPQFNGPVQPGHRWRLTRLGEQVLDVVRLDRVLNG